MSAGEQVVHELRRVLEPPGDRVAEQDESGFTWWPHAHAQRIAAEESRTDGACVVSAETLLLEGVTGRAAELGALARRNARDAGLSALRWDSERGTISLRAAVIARPDDGGAAARRLAHAAVLQLGEALRVADALAVEFPGATLVASPDVPAVETVESWRTYAGVAPSESETLADAVQRLLKLTPAPWARATAAAHGLDAELACRTTGGAGAPGEGMALLRLSARQPHPRLGPGLVAVLVPPPDAEPVAERAPATAALLNEGESREWTGADQLGGWCVHPAAGLAHAVFVPALAIESDSLERMAWQAGARARWAMTFLERVAALRTSSGSRS